MSDRISLTPEQLAAVRTGAASVPSCWYDRFLYSVLDHLRFNARDRPIADGEVIAAIDVVRANFHAWDDFEDCC